MTKKLKDLSRSKKGFTLVELIVVIVILLVLGAALVPRLLKYVDDAQRASVRSDAATVLSQLQADYAAYVVDPDQSDIAAGVERDENGNFTVAGVTVTLGEADVEEDGGACYAVENSEIVYFQYRNNGVRATWDSRARAQGGGGWTIEAVE